MKKKEGERERGRERGRENERERERENERGQYPWVRNLIIQGSRLPRIS